MCMYFDPVYKLYTILLYKIDLIEHKTFCYKRTDISQAPAGCFNP